VRGGEVERPADRQRADRSEDGSMPDRGREPARVELRNDVAVVSAGTAARHRGDLEVSGVSHGGHLSSARFAGATIRREMRDFEAKYSS
jgi:hypothetical protein